MEKLFGQVPEERRGSIMELFVQIATNQAKSESDRDHAIESLRRIKEHRPAIGQVEKAKQQLVLAKQTLAQTLFDKNWLTGEKVTFEA